MLGAELRLLSARRPTSNKRAPMFLSSSTLPSLLPFDHFKPPTRHILPSPNKSNVAAYPGAFPSVLSQLLNQYPTTSSPNQLREQILTSLETVHFEPTTLADTVQDITLCQICDRIPVVLLKRLRVANFKDFSPDDLCKVYGAFAYTNHRVTAVLDKLAEDLLRRSTSGALKEFSPEQLASVINSLAVLNYRGNAQFSRALGREVESRANRFMGADLGLVLQSMAKLKLHDSPSAVDSLANALFAKKSGRRVDAATFSKSVDALARLDASSETKQLISTALQTVPPLKFSPQQQATMVCSLSKLDMLSEPSAHAMVPKELESFASQDVAKMATACAGEATARQTFAQALGRDLLRRDLTSVDTTDLLALLRASADFGLQNQHGLVSELSTRNMSKFTLAELVDLTRTVINTPRSTASEQQLIRALTGEISTRDWNAYSHAELSSLIGLFEASKVPLPSNKFIPRSDDYVSKCTLDELVMITNTRLALPPQVVRRITQEWLFRKHNVCALQTDQIAHVLRSFTQFHFYNKELCSSLASALTEPSDGAAIAVRILADLKHSDQVPFALLMQNLARYSPASLVRMAWANAELGFGYAEALAKEAVLRGPTAFIPRDTATLFIALAKSHLTVNCNVERLVPHNLHKFNYRDLADCVIALSRMQTKGDVSQRFAMEICTRGAQQFETPQLMFMLKAFAKWSNSAATPSIAKELATRASQLSPLHLCFTLISLAKLGHGAAEESSLQRLAEEISSRPNATRLDLVQSLQALADLETPCRTLFDRISSSSSTGVYNAQDATSIVSSAVKLGYTDIKLLRKLCMEVEMDEYTPQALANLMWAFAKSQRFPADVFNALSKEVLKRDLSTFTPNSLALLLWACSREEVLDMAKNLYTNLLKEVESRGTLKDFNGQDLANLSQALVAFKSMRFAVFDIIGKEVASRGKLAPQEITTILRSFAQAQYWCNPLMDWVCTHTELIPKYTSQDLSTVMQSFARLGLTNTNFCCKVADECTARKLQAFSMQSIVNLLHSFACLDVLAKPNIARVFAIDSLPHFVNKEDRTYEVAQQLYQVRMAWGTEHPSPLLDSLCGTGEEEWVTAMVSQFPPENAWTEAHEAVRSVFETQRKLPKFQQQAQVGLLPVDFLFDGVERCIVEVEGPMRYLVNIPQQLTGKALFKHRLLEAQGYTVFSLPLREVQAKNSVQRGQMVGKIGSKIREAEYRAKRDAVAQ